MYRNPIWVYIVLSIFAVVLFISAIYMIINEPQAIALIIGFIIIFLSVFVYVSICVYDLVKIKNKKQQYSNKSFEFLKITGSELVDYIEIDNDFIVINYRKKNTVQNRKILKNEISTIEINTRLVMKYNNSNVFIKLKNGNVINFNMDIMSLYDFIKQMKLICDIKHNIQTINKLDDYKKEILEKDIEYYIEHGKKMSINSKIKLSVNKFYYNLILAFILFIVCMFLLSFVN